MFQVFIQDLTFAEKDDFPGKYSRICTLCYKISELIYPIFDLFALFDQFPKPGILLELFILTHWEF